MFLEAEAVPVTPLCFWAKQLRGQLELQELLVLGS